MTTAIHVYGDPLDPRGWGSEPAVRRLRTALPDADWLFHPVVLVADWETYDGPEFRSQGAVPAACSRVSERSEMPIDEFLWFDDAPVQSEPATHGVAAAFEQGETAGWRFLRAGREATFIRRQNLDSTAAVVNLAGETDGVDADSLAQRLDQGVSLSTPDPTDVPGVEMAGDRPSLPTVVVRGEAGKRGHSGLVDFAQLTRLVTGATGSSPDPPTLSIEEVLERFSPEGWLAVTELSVLAQTGYETVVDAAREASGVTERSFASEPFFRATEFVTDADDPSVDKSATDLTEESVDAGGGAE